VSGKVSWKDTEQDLVLALAAYWQAYLQPQLEGLLREEVLRNKCVRLDDVNVVVSVTDRLTAQASSGEGKWESCGTRKHACSGWSIVVTMHMCAWCSTYRST
jgi:hypothetical protein